MACIKPGSDLDRKRKKWEAWLIAEGKTPAEAATRAEAMAVNADKARIAKQKQQLALQTAKVSEARKFIAEAKSGKEAKARLDSFVQRDEKGRWNDRVNIVSKQKELRAVARNKMADTLEVSMQAEAMDPAAKAALDRAIRQELGGVATGNTAAAKAATGLRAAADFMKARANSAGMAIKTLSDWAYPQTWDGELVAPKGDAQAWVDDMWRAYNTPGAMRPLVSRDGNVLTGDSLKEALFGIAENIRVGNVVGDVGKLPGAMKNRHLDPREIGFLDHNLRLEMEAKYSRGDIFSKMEKHVETLAREVGAMEVLGPNPNAAYAEAREIAKRKGAGDFGLNGSDSAYLYATGALSNPAMPNWALGGMTFRSYLSASLLTAALPSQFSDIIPRSLVSAANGVPVMRDLAEFFKALPKELSAEDIKALTRMGVDAETALTRLIDDGILDTQTAIGNVTDKVMRWSGMRKWNETGRVLSQTAILRTMADNAGLAFAEADAAMGGKLTQYGYTPEVWDAIRTHGIGEFRGIGHVSADAIDRAAGSGALDPKLAADAIQRVIHHVGSESDLAMTIPQPRVRAAMAGRAQAGTVTGEIARTATQFKSFSTQFLINQVGEMARKQGTDRVSHAATLLVGLTGLGAIAYQSKRLLKGQGAAEMDPSTDEGRAFWAAAFMQGGGLGVLGDFAAAGMGGTNRFNQEFLSSLLGPGAGFVNDAFKTTFGNVGEAARGERANSASEAIRFAGRYTPGLNLPFIGLAAQRLVTDRLRLVADPSGTRRSFMTQEQKQRQEFNSRYWWRPGRALPEFAR